MRSKEKRRKKKKIEGGSNWILSYSDTATLLLCFFVILFVIEKSDIQEIQLIFSSFRDTLGFLPDGKTINIRKDKKVFLRTTQPTSEGKDILFIQVKQLAANLLALEAEKQTINIESTERGILVSLVSTDFFNKGSAEMQTEIKNILKKLSYLISKINHFVRIEGHCSQSEAELLQSYTGNSPHIRQERIYEDTWDLSSARAIKVAKFLVTQGTKPYILQTVGFGHHRPLDIEISPRTPEAAAHNQRIDILISRHKIKRTTQESNYSLPNTRIPAHESLSPE